MASLYNSQYRSKTGLTTAGLHVYRSHYDSATKQVVKTRLGVIAMNGAGIPPELAGQLSANELREVQAKVKTVTTAAARTLRAQADLIEKGQQP